MGITYRACKLLITNGRYDSKEDMQQKLDIFLLNNRITDDEYNELSQLLRDYPE